MTNNEAIRLLIQACDRAIKEGNVFNRSEIVKINEAIEVFTKPQNENSGEDSKTKEN